MTIKVTTTEELYSKVLVVYGYGCGVWLQGGCMNPTFVTQTQLQPSTCGEHGTSTALFTGYFSFRRRNNFSVQKYLVGL